MAKIMINENESLLVIESQFFDARPRSVPVRKWDRQRKVWFIKPCIPNIRHILKEFEPHEFSDQSYYYCHKQLNDYKKYESATLPFPYHITFRTKPMAHQAKALDLAWAKDEFALFMEMGTGKTWIAIQWLMGHILVNQVQRILVVCPASVQSVWPSEILKHSSYDVDVFVLESATKDRFKEWVLSTQPDPMIVIASMEGFSQGKLGLLARQFLAANVPTAMIVDESSGIKNHDSIRSTQIVETGKYADFKMIMTGTSISQGIQDLFMQYRFLNWEIIGQPEYFPFRSRYCEMGGYGNKKIIGYTRTDELMDFIGPYTFVVRKKDVLDLPPKVYEKRYVDKTPEQTRVLAELKDKMISETKLMGSNYELICETVLERTTRYQQVCGGFFPHDIAPTVEDIAKCKRRHGVQPLKGGSKKLDAMMADMDLLQPEDKVIIWAIFKAEQEMIFNAMRDKYGNNAVEWYTTGFTVEQQHSMILRFQEDPACRIWVSSPRKGGLGLTLTAANYVFYYSNSWSLIDREQSEDRAHRIGQDKSVTYIDYITKGTVEGSVLLALMKKQQVADFVYDQLQDGKTLEDLL